MKVNTGTSNRDPQDDLSTRDKIMGPIVSLAWRFHCKETYVCPITLGAHAQ